MERDPYEVMRSIWTSSPRRYKLLHFICVHLKMRNIEYMGTFKWRMIMTIIVITILIEVVLFVRYNSLQKIRVRSK